MEAGPAPKYFWFLLITGAIALLIYLIFKSVFDVAGTYFLLTAVGQAHFMMGYIWSVPEYRRWTGKMRIENLIIFLGIAAVLYFIFYHSGLFTRNTLWLLVIFSGIAHFMRDYRYFFNQLRSGFANHDRPVSWTAALAGLFFIIFFGILLIVPEQQSIVLDDPTHSFLAFYRIMFVVSVICFAAALISILYSQKEKVRLSVSKNYLALAPFAILPAILQPIFKYVTITDFFLFIAFWHIIQWYGYMTIKIHYRTLTNVNVATVRSITDKIYHYWGKNAFWFLGLTLLSDAVLLGSFIFLIQIGVWPNFETAVSNSFFWGVGGYALFSVLHFIFTALLTLYAKRARTQPTPFLA